MPATIIDGNALANEYRAEISRRVKAVESRAGHLGKPVHLDALMVDSGDSAARQYADSQARACAAMGIHYKLHTFSPNASYEDIAGRILLLNSQREAAAIMVHLPMPPGVDPHKIQRLIAPEKDVEGVNPANIGNVVYGQSSLVPCTALAVLKMIESTKVEIRGKLAVVVGAGDVVGKPIAVLLMRKEATVVSCNRYTQDLASLTCKADILVAAAGVPGLIKAEMVKPGAVVIDVGVNRVKDAQGKTKTMGDVDFPEVVKIAGHVSPVPGGVGPMTVAMLLLNVVEAAETGLVAARRI